MSDTSILVTGGTGYIGSHTCVALVEAGYQPVILDNLSNSDAAVVERIAEISGYRPPLYEADVRDAAVIARVLAAHKPIAAIHFAGLKAVGESVAQPARYYANNVMGAIALFEGLLQADPCPVLFSSSASVYGSPDQCPIPESAPLRPESPYARTKLVIEQILQDMRAAYPEWRTGILRYFNPVGAHPSGRIGEAPLGVPNNLAPYVAQVAAGRREFLNVYGNDYPTPDGTGVRDYVHVMDLAEGHVKGLQRLLAEAGTFTVNLGTGRGYSVLELVAAFERASGAAVPYRMVARRPGDVAACFADASHAQQALGWRARRDLAEMCADLWRWQVQNPTGYRDF
jgi:UDP-glucose 4-epimerase